MTDTPASPLAAPPTALDLCGTGVVVYADPATSDLIVVPTRCHRWDCSSCGPARQAGARARGRAGRPERIITLTLRPRKGENLAEQVDFIRLAYRRLIQRIRRVYGSFEFMAALELQKSGTPHLHVLQRGSYIPQRWLSSAWLSLTGSFKVHIQKIDHVEGAIDELTKYLCKTAAQVQEACPGRPLWTMSRNWLPPDFDDQSDREPRDPYACHFRLAMADVEFVLEKLDAFLEEVPDRPYHYAVKWRSMPDPAFLSTYWYLEGSQEYWLAYYLLWREGALECPDRHAILELHHYGHLSISPAAEEHARALRAA